jgi:hypothetical protein
MNAKLKITPSTGNVFRDLEFRREEAEHLLVRAGLIVQKLITSRRLTHPHNSPFIVTMPP